MKTDEAIRNHVMRRVYVVYYARLLAQPATRVGAMAVLGLALLSSVSIINVVANATAVGGLAHLVYFAVAAFTLTTPIVQLITLALLVLLGWFALDTIKKLEPYFQSKRSPALAQ